MDAVEVDGYIKVILNRKFSFPIPKILLHVSLNDSSKRR